jgi:hypothetical protein
MAQRESTCWCGKAIEYMDPHRLCAQVADLREMCKERKITGYSKLRKSALVRTLKEAMLADA